MIEAAKRLWAWFQKTRLYVAYQRYSKANGDLLAAGVGYFAFFSIFPALALGFAIFGFVLAGRPDLLATIADSLNEALPNMVRTANNPDGIIGLSAPSNVALTVTGIVSLVILILAGLGWIGALRTGIRGIFGLEASPDNAVKTRLRDAGVLAGLGLGVVISAILTSVVGALAGTVAEWIGFDGGGFVVTIIGLAIGVTFDTLLMVLLLRLLSGVPLPWSDVRDGALFGGVLITALKYFGSALIAGVVDNPLLGAVAVAVGLLFWLNLMSRIVLLSASFAANRSDLHRIASGDEGGTWASIPRPQFIVPLTASVDTSTVPYGGTAPAAVDPDRPGGQSLAPAPSRQVDRASIVAGAVLGAAMAGVATAVRRLRSR